MKFDFPTAFKKKMLTSSPSFEVVGILSRDEKVYSLGSDTKVISTIFELISRPYVFQVASDYGFKVLEPRQQNYYPDFTLLRYECDSQKIAVDVKTTYRRFTPAGNWKASFTLGSYTSFMRNNTKNIAFPYDQYAKHYVIGFIYTRRQADDLKVFSYGEHEKAKCPFLDVKWFVQEKHRVASERPGSGNTTNIGSIVASSNEEFAEGNGPFTQFGEEVFVDYWRNFGTTAGNRAYKNLSEYWDWKNQA